jgi:hypothetical protein
MNESFGLFGQGSNKNGDFWSPFFIKKKDDAVWLSVIKVFISLVELCRPGFCAEAKLLYNNMPAL